jgi:hypothetical protein
MPLSEALVPELDQETANTRKLRSAFPDAKRLPAPQRHSGARSARSFR